MDGTTLFLGHFGMGRFRMGRFCMWAVLGWAVFIWDDLVSGPTSPESITVNSSTTLCLVTPSSDQVAYMCSNYQDYSLTDLIGKSNFFKTCWTFFCSSNVTL